MESTPRPPGRDWKKIAKTTAALIFGLIPVVVVFLEATGLNTQVQAAGIVSGVLYGVLRTAYSPPGRAFIARFAPWLMTKEQERANHDYVGKHWKDKPPPE